MNLDEKRNFIVNVTYFALWAVLIILILNFASKYLFPFLIGIIVAYLVQKPARKLSLKCGIKKEILAAVFSVVFFILIITVVALLFWFLCMQVTEIIDFFSKYTDELNQYIERASRNIGGFFSEKNLLYNDKINNLTNSITNGIVTKFGNFLSDTIANIVKKLPNLFISSIITVVATFYISKDYEKLKKFLCGIISVKKLNFVIEIKNIISDCFLKFLVGYFWIFIITFAELLIGFVVLGVNKFLVAAFIVALLDLLPVIGTGTVLLPWSVLSFACGNFSQGIGLLTLYVIIVVVRNFAEPRIIGKQIEINPLFMLVFIFIGLKFGGILGMFLFPVILTVLFTYLKRKYTAV